ncbi:MAG TPA: DUF2085 domain-containing protein [Anaerolineales bacterium]|nr:DUF2085 domain-containing protein [Anaerolineales bacterium]
MDNISSLNAAKAISRWLIPLAAIFVFVLWVSITPPGLLGKADAIGYAICHRIDERSFHIEDRQLPLCARCTGEFLSAGLTILFLSLFSTKHSGMPGWKIGIPLILFFLAFGVDGTNSYLYLLKQTSAGALENIPNLYVPNNTLRLLTGSGMGIAIGSILFPAFNQTAWRTSDPRPALDGKKFGILTAFIFSMDILLLTEHTLILYLFAIFSVLGALTLLIMVFSMAWTLVMGSENTFDSLPQMWMPLLGGTTAAFLLILLIDLIRFRLTGTWGGFSLG